jgi:dihydrofolate reductase
MCIPRRTARISRSELSKTAPAVRRTDDKVNGNSPALRPTTFVNERVNPMGKIGVHEFVSLDGVFETPTWTAPYGFTEGMGRAIGELTAASSAMLLGRTTYEMFAPAWSGRTVEEDPGAPFFNDTTKYVVSSTLRSAEGWQNSTVLGAYDATAIRELKEQIDGGIYISGSGTLVRALLADGLVDELHLLVYPIVLGSGAKLFPEGTQRTPLALAAHETFENGVLHLTYGPSAG